MRARWYSRWNTRRKHMHSNIQIKWRMNIVAARPSQVIKEQQRAADWAEWCGLVLYTVSDLALSFLLSIWNLFLTVQPNICWWHLDASQTWPISISSPLTTYNMLLCTLCTVCCVTKCVAPGLLGVLFKRLKIITQWTEMKLTVKLSLTWCTVRVTKVKTRE